MSGKRLSRRTRTLLLTTVALLAVIGLLVAVLFLLPEKPKDNTDAPSTESTIVLVDKTADEKTTLSSATVTVGDTSYTLVEGKDELYTIKGYEDLPLDQETLLLTASTFLKITADEKIAEHPETPSEFGFGISGTNIAITAAYSDNTTFTCEIGNAVPADGGYYLLDKTTDIVYVSDGTLRDAVNMSVGEFMDHSPIIAPEATETTDTAVVRDVTLSGSVRPHIIHYEAANEPSDKEDVQFVTGYVITKPYYHTVSNSTVTLTTGAYTSITAASVVKMRPTAADLAAYGLNNPYSTCTVNLSLKRVKEEVKDGNKVENISYHSTFEYTIKLSKPDKDGNYCGVIYSENKLIPLIYQFTAGSIEWAEAQYEDIADNLLFFRYIHHLKSLSLTLDGKKTDFTLAHHLDEKEADDRLTVTAGGKTYDTASFRNVYNGLMNTFREDEADASLIKGQPILTINMIPESDPTLTIDVYEYTVGTCIVRHSTGEIHTVKAKSVQEVMNRCRKLVAGEKV